MPRGRKKKKDVTNGKEKQNCHSLQSARRKYKEFTDTVVLKFSEANQRSLWLSGNEVWPAVKERWETWVHSLGWEDALEKENGTSLQYACQENAMDAEGWRAKAHEVTKSWTRLSTHQHHAENRAY